MAHNHHPQPVATELVEDMIRESSEVGTTETAVNGRKTEGVFCGLNYLCVQLAAKLIRNPVGNSLVVTENLQHIPADQPMELYFHAKRSRSMEAQNSSAARGRDWPVSSSSRRRTASAMPRGSHLRRHGGAGYQATTRQRPRVHARPTGPRHFGVPRLTCPYFNPTSFFAQYNL